MNSRYENKKAAVVGKRAVKGGASQKIAKASSKIILTGRTGRRRFGAGPMHRVSFVNIQDPSTGQKFRIHRRYFPQLTAYLEQLEKGQAVQIVPADQTITTQEAADLLNVSRPFVVKLIEDGTLKHTMVGTHRRLFPENVLAYKAQAKTKRSDALQKLADDAQALSLGY